MYNMPPTLLHWNSSLSSLFVDPSSTQSRVNTLSQRRFLYTAVFQTRDLKSYLLTFEGSVKCFWCTVSQKQKMYIISTSTSLQPFGISYD